MKRLIWTVLGLGTLVGAVFYVNHSLRHTGFSAETMAAPGPVTLSETPSAAEAAVIQAPSLASATHSSWPRPRPAVKAISTNANLEPDLVQQTLTLLISPQTSHEQREAAWQRLQHAEQLDPAIRKLEQSLATGACPVEYSALLGQAYLKKCATLHDVREQGLLALQADRLFDTALNLNSANWEARFTKAVALSFWPASMNKGDEVKQHFLTLIQQQEAQTPQPHFAESYLWLGDSYQKQGQIDQAQGVWERGLNLFPKHAGLRNKLATASVTPPSESANSR